MAWGEYPERRPGAHDHRRALSRGTAHLQRFADAAGAAAQVAEGEVPRELQALREQVPGSEAWLLRAVVLAASALARTSGHAPHRQQLLAARVLLDDRLAEMATGEGKTGAIAIAAAVAALARTPVHVVTANDYLAQRDAERLRPFYESLGLRVDCVVQAMDAARRRTAYGADIAYCTAK
ncbi:MAG TPA: hypothetical protein VNB23_02140, partial [Ramlibacter sp.]|nr:hypothetical protein [Ramlibacter sp.]